jgi:Zn-dependent protease
MLPTHSGSIRFFRFGGIQVYIHWWWFLVAIYQISRPRTYSSPVWNAVEYLALFAIVLMHEFGHAFACRQTGGTANEIILWPLGGVAFVQPPQRPGAQLWSIAAGPLVNVALVPVLFGFLWARRAFGLGLGNADFGLFLVQLVRINLVLLIFNLLPIYPLDGGQIVRSLLWFFVGRARSLQIAAIFGFVGVAGLLGLAIWWESFWIGIMAFFAGQRCLVGYREAKALQAIARLPRHQDFACPNCHESPPGGPIWMCSNCRNRFDTFSTRAVCPHCGAAHPQTACIFCGKSAPIEQWEKSPRRAAGEPPVIDI